MSIDTSLHTFGTAIESLGEDDVGVERMSVETTGDELTTQMTVAFPLELAEAATTVTVDGGAFTGGTVTVDVSMSFDESGLEQLESMVQSTDKGGPAVEGEHSPPATGTPAYKDPERLEEVYEQYDSFAAMTEALDVDVTAQTVRRNMMKHGIHTPNTAEESHDTDESEQSHDGDETVAEGSDAPTPDFDDVDLPDGVTPAAVRDAVVESSSLHGVQLALDLEMRDTRALLQDLGVLEHVTGRLADKDAAPDPGEIEQQIYDSLAAHADGGQRDA